MGDYSSIYNTLKILSCPKTKNKKAKRIELNENNSLFMDIEAVQKSKVTLYNFTLAGVTLLPCCMLGFGLGCRFEGSFSISCINLRVKSLLKATSQNKSVFCNQY
jgi:hypothetical protein